jgi:cobalamin biosynthesis protein CbiG
VTTSERRRIAEYLARRAAIADAAGRKDAAAHLASAAGDVANGRDSALTSRALLAALTAERAAQKGGRPRANYRDRPPANGGQDGTAGTSTT